MGDTTSSFVISGGLVGGQIGYNYQFANHMILGLETDIDYANISNANSTSDKFYGFTPYVQQGYISNNNERLGLNWLGSTRGRLGYAFNNLLPYLTGGIAYGQLTSSLSSGSVQSVIFSNFGNTSFNSVSGNIRQNQIGWVVGAGLEYKFADAWSIKSEYLYSSLSGITRNDVNILSGAVYSFSKTTNDTFSIHQARIGLNYHTGWGGNLSALATKY
jgi:outer membrane immunogenic protein